MVLRKFVVAMLCDELQGWIHGIELSRAVVISVPACSSVEALHVPMRVSVR